MTSLEFIKKNKALFDEAKRIKSKSEFIKFLDEHNIEVDDISKEEAYDLLNNEDKELAQEELEAIAGGASKADRKKEEIKQRVNPDALKGNMAEISEAKAKEMLASSNKNVFLDPTSNKWFKMG